jgi:hypothetical protein
LPADAKWKGFSGADATRKAIVTFGGNATFRFRVEEPAEELINAESAGDAASEFAITVVCGAAGSTGVADSSRCRRVRLRGHDAVCAGRE